MTFITRAALAAALTMGLSTTAMVAPAAAQKNKKGDDGAPQLKLSDAVRKPVAAAQAALAANDTATALAQLATAEAAAKTDDERYIVAALRLKPAAEGGDRSKMIPVLDALIANPKTPAADLPRYTYFRGALAFEAKRNQEALPYLIKARELGYSSPELPLQIAQASVDSGNISGGVAEINKAIDAETAAGRKAPQAWYDYAISRLYNSGDRAQSAVWLKKSIAAYPTPQNWRKMIIIYRDGDKGGRTALDKGQRLDLYRLLGATNALADQGDYLEFADLALQFGLPAEAVRVIDAGRSKGIVPAANGSAKQIYAQAQDGVKRDTPLATLEKQANAAANGKAAASTADAYLAAGEYAKASTLYRTALQKGGVDASLVNLHLGIALAQSGQKAEAKTAFAAVTAGANADIAGFWTQWVDQSGAA